MPSPTVEAMPVEIVGAEANPKIHRPMFKEVSKHVWRAARKTPLRKLKLNPANKYYEFPKLGLATGTVGFVGFMATGATGHLTNIGVDRVAQELGRTASPLLEPIKDMVRIGVEGGFGMAVYPSFGHNITGRESLGKAMFAGAAILTAVDVGMTGGKYIARVWKGRQVSQVSPEQKAAMDVAGLGSLAEFIKGTAETAATAEDPHTAEVADLSKLSEADAERMLAAELRKYGELSAQMGGVGQNAGSLMR